jgi:uncharacterized membrane protein HdeD (DUF308 family)
MGSLWLDVLLRGIIAILFGLLVFIWHGITLIALSYVIAFYAILGA